MNHWIINFLMVLNEPTKFLDDILELFKDFPVLCRVLPPCLQNDFYFYVKNIELFGIVLHVHDFIFVTLIKIIHKKIHIITPNFLTNFSSFIQTQLLSLLFFRNFGVLPKFAHSGWEIFYDLKGNNRCKGETRSILQVRMKYNQTILSYSNSKGFLDEA